MQGLRSRYAAVFLFALLVEAGFAQGDDPSKELERAREAMQKGRLEEAYSRLQILEHAHPQWPHLDEAIYRLGDVRQQLGLLEEAYQTFARFSRRFPRSAFRDEAEVRKLHLAQKFYHDGKTAYKQVLLDGLRHRDERVRREAALVLAELGNPAAAEIVSELTAAKDPYLRRRARAVQQRMQAAPVLVKSEDLSAEHARITFDIPSGERAREKPKKSWRENFLFIKSRRYKLYEQLHEAFFARDHEWSADELMDYGLFHIIPEDEFAEYFSLRDPYDRAEWRRKFWKKNDPTPGTPRNELRELFEERVAYARAHFGEVSTYHKFRFLANQYLREDDSWSPWDSRGELYVKFGKPDFIENVALHQEIWYYFKLGASFGVNHYMNNLYHNGIFPAGGLSFRHDTRPFQVDVEYINNNLMLVPRGEKYNTLKGVRLHLGTVQQGDSLKVRFRYDVPRKSLKFVELPDGRRQARLQVRYAVRDADLIDQASGRWERNFEFADTAAMHAAKGVGERVSLHLLAGEYILIVQVEDERAMKRATIKREISWGMASSR